LEKDEMRWADGRYPSIYAGCKEKWMSGEMSAKKKIGGESSPNKEYRYLFFIKSNLK